MGAWPQGCSARKRWHLCLLRRAGFCVCVFLVPATSHCVSPPPPPPLPFSSSLPIPAKKETSRTTGSRISTGKLHVNATTATCVGTGECLVKPAVQRVLLVCSRGLIATQNEPCLSRVAVLARCSTKGPHQARPLSGPVLLGICVGALHSSLPAVMPSRGQGGSRDPPSGFFSPPGRLAPTCGTASCISPLGGPCQAPPFPARARDYNRTTTRVQERLALLPAGDSRKL
jgi:hypothetical protein